MSLTTSQWLAFKQAFGPNGFFMVSGYDLGPGEAGKANSLKDYAKYLYDQLSAMKAAANAHDIYYMVGIPTAASTKEFEQTVTYPGVAGSKSGYSQLDYVRVAMDLMFNLEGSPSGYGPFLRGLLPASPPYIYPLNLHEDLYFLGWSMWSWATGGER